MISTSLWREVAAKLAEGVPEGNALGLGAQYPALVHFLYNQETVFHNMSSGLKNI